MKITTKSLLLFHIGTPAFTLSLFFLCLMFSPFPLMAQEADLTFLTLEELMDIEITSVSKKNERLADAAAAIFVIRQEDIRRSGVTSIPEALRMVPGLQVARVDSSTWAISSRGFNGRFANKLLVLIDGRSVYTPSHSGVYWEMQDTFLDDVDRIEVIRGPGASLWGANAVNGVINVITKKAEETQGVIMTAGVGSEEKGFGSIRYGGNLSDKAYYRFYAKGFERDGSLDNLDRDMPDSWDMKRGGFRFDWQQGTHGDATIQGDIFSGDVSTRVTLPALGNPPAYKTIVDHTAGSSSGGNILARIQRRTSSGSEVVLQSYYDRFERKEATWQENRDTFDIDFTHRFTASDRHEITWGLGYRYTRGETENTTYLMFTQGPENDQLLSAFLQDNISLKKDRLSLTLGSKLEHNDYTGVEVQPSARLLWTPDDKNTVWAAVSRAVRTPSQVETDGQLYAYVEPSVPPVKILVSGNTNFESEDLIAYEVGGRTSIMDMLSLDLALFYNTYDNLRSGNPGQLSLGTGLPFHLVLPYTSSNQMSGKCYGGELSVEYMIQDWWKLQASYTYLDMQLDMEANSGDTVSEAAENESPENQVSLRSSMDLSKNVQFDLWFRYVDELASFEIERYFEMDLRLAWKPSENVEFSIVGQNLLDDQHQEFEAEIFISPAAEVERSIYGKVMLLF